MRTPSLTIVALACGVALYPHITRAAQATPSFRDEIASRSAGYQSDDPFVKALQRFDGERVLIPLMHMDAWEDRPVALANTLLGRIQNFCEAFTPKEKSDQPDMIPFGVRGTWVIAPATQLAINYDYRFVDPRTARSRTAAARDAVMGIPGAMLPSVGSDSGVPLVSLPAAVQESLLLALRPPFSVSQRLPNDMQNPPDAPKPIQFSEELNPRSLRFRMRLRSAPPMLRSSTGASYSGTGLPWPADTNPWLEIEPSVRTGSFNLQAVLQVPNKYKQTDLDGAKLTQPLGIHGLQYVAAILQGVERVTGLKLHAKDSWESKLVYIGTDSVTCGEALDGLRLVFTGAWRKVGGLYFLSWDREGIRYAQYRWSKAAGPVMDAVKSSEPDALNDERWETIARKTPFASDDPMRWSDEQRQALFGERTDGAKDPFADRPSFFYPQMTPEQQEVVRTRVVRVPSNPPDAPDSVPSTRHLYPEELSRVALSESVTLEAEVDLPGAGWVRLDIGYVRSMDASRLDSARSYRRVVAEIASHPKLTPTYHFYVNPWGYSAYVPEATERVVMLPALAPDKMPAMAAKLKNLGLTTLVYPLLFNGYSTIPGLAFPLDPVLKGANGWSAAVKAARANGLHILGSVNVLEWRAYGRTGHWLDADPSWLDMDDAGRTRSQWFAGLGAASLDYRLEAAIGGDLIRVAMPEVQTRLEGLIDAAAMTAGADGIVFDKWDESPNVPAIWRYEIPRLGFREPDREAVVLKLGMDPVDEPAPVTSFRTDDSGVPEDGEPVDGGHSTQIAYRVAGRDVVPPPRNPAEMASRMLDGFVLRTRNASHGWKAWVVEEGADQSWRYGNSQSGPKAPAGDVVLYTWAESGIRQTANVLVRVPSTRAIEADPQVPPEVRPWPGLAVSLNEQFRTPHIGSGDGHVERLVFDFRGTSEDPAASLKWVSDHAALADRARDAYFADNRKRGQKTAK